jgi:hypothetical protein
MPSKRVQRAVNPRKLTEDETAETRRLRELVDNDKDEILTQGRRILAEKRRRQAAGRRSEPRGRLGE